MGYYSKVKGGISFSPKLRISEARANPVIAKYLEDSEEYPDIVLYSFYGGSLDTIEGVTQDSFKAYFVEENLKELVAALGDRAYTGRLEIYGEDDGDITGLRVKNGVVEQIEPKLVWPED